VPALLLLFLFLYLGHYSAKVQLTVGLVAGGFWLACAFAVRERFIRPVQTISNMVAALREDDFSLRARGASAWDDLGLVFLELNALGETLRQQRLGAQEATALLRRVMAEIDVAVFAFDKDGRVRLANAAAARLLGQRPDQLAGRTAAELGLAGFLEGEPTGVREAVFAGRAGRFGLRRGAFRQGGRPHTLLVLADVSRALREEERQAWQRLVRVLGHEINNSLAPIRSVTQSLRARLGQREGDGLEQELRGGLDLIGARSEALARFMNAYARLARLPRPSLSSVDVASCVQRVAGLETRLPVRVSGGPPQSVQADADQLEQLLINLVRNAADAAIEAHGTEVEIGWRVDNGHLEVLVRDDGPGLPHTTNLFVPFFTTKPNGSGIGLALSRQIAEGHGGTLTLANREGTRGCQATLRLPVRI